MGEVPFGFQWDHVSSVHSHLDVAVTVGVNQIHLCLLVLDNVEVENSF